MSVITQWGDSALMEAARVGKTEVVVELVKAGTNMDIQNEVCSYIMSIRTFVVHNVLKRSRLNFHTLQWYT